MGELQRRALADADAPIPPIEVFDVLDSTNAEARRRAEAGECGPVWIVARRQSAGRGRRGRAWSTETGNLAATLLTVFDGPPTEAARLSFVAALAIADVFDAFVPPSTVAIKWPNDVLIAGRKASGVLIESGSRNDGLLWLAIGCGLNLEHAPEVGDWPTARLADHLRHDAPAAPGVETAASLLAAAFARRCADLVREGFVAIADAWTERAAGLGAPCVARLGRETVEGIAEGLEPDGALRLRLADGTLRRVTAADVFLAPA